MAADIDVDLGKLAQSVAALPLFGGEGVALAQLASRQGVQLYLVISDSGVKAALKLFTEIEGASAFEKARLRAAAEAEGLRIFAPLGLAPELHSVVTLPEAPGAYGVLEEWTAAKIVGERPLAAAELEAYARAMRTIHANDSLLKLLSPTPRSLERWWTTAHEIYRDLPSDLMADIPEEVRTALTALAQSVAADVHTHKRFWHNVPLVPVQGAAYETSLAFNDEQPIFLDWHRFGQGDAAHEVAGACLTIERLSGAEAAQHFTDLYLGDLDDPSFSSRIDICRRTLPFGRVMEVLKELTAPGEDEQDAVLVTAEIGHFLRLSMLTYGRDRAEADHVVAALGAWVGERWAAEGAAK